MIRVYAIVVGLALLCAGVWRWHHNVFEAGRAEQKKADDKALNESADANAAFQRTLEAAKASETACEDGRIADAKTAKDAAAEADAARAALIAKARKSDKALADRMAGECHEWAKQPACASVP